MTLQNVEGNPPATTLCEECRRSVIRVELDFPPAELFPNRAKGTHWGKLYQLRSDYRETSTWLAKHQLKNWKHAGKDIKLTLTFEMPDKRKRDADNCLAAAKGALDGLADAMMVNDQYFQPIMIYRKIGTKPGKLIVEIKEQT
jgi:Holliday junction resolvase RusA-like endonuclease